MAYTASPYPEVDWLTAMLMGEAAPNDDAKSMGALADVVMNRAYGSYAPSTAYGSKFTYAPNTVAGQVSAMSNDRDGNPVVPQFSSWSLEQSRREGNGSGGANQALMSALTRGADAFSGSALEKYNRARAVASSFLSESDPDYGRYRGASGGSDFFVANGANTYLRNGRYNVQPIGKSEFFRLKSNGDFLPWNDVGDTQRLVPYDQNSPLNAWARGGGGANYGDPFGGVGTPLNSNYGVSPYGFANGNQAPPGFDGAAYLARNEDVARAGLDPWQHFVTYGRDEGRSAPGLSDGYGSGASGNFSDFYGNPTAGAYAASPYGFGSADVAGGMGATAASMAPPGFTANTYLALNPDIAKNGIDPFTHWMMYGAKENRQGSGLDAAQTLAGFYGDPNASARVSSPFGFGGGFDVSGGVGAQPASMAPPDFNANAYLAANPDVLINGMSPWEHFRTYGAQEHREGSGINPADYGVFGINGPTTAAYPVTDTGFSAMNPSAGMGAGSFADLQPLTSAGVDPTSGLPALPAVPLASYDEALNYGLASPEVPLAATIPGAVPFTSVPDAGSPFVPGAVPNVSAPEVAAPFIPGDVPNVSVPDTGTPYIPPSPLAPTIDLANYAGGFGGNVSGGAGASPTGFADLIPLSPTVNDQTTSLPFPPDAPTPLIPAPDRPAPGAYDFVGSSDVGGGLGALPTSYAGLTPLTPAGDGPGGFNRAAYLAANPDVRSNGIDPLQHFLSYGASEHRLGSGVADAQSFAQLYGPQYLNPAAAPPISPFGFGEAYNPSGFMGAQPATSMAPAGFNAAAYLAANPDVARNGMGAWDHFQTYGRQEGRQGSGLSPSEYGAFSVAGAGGFNAASYLAANPDVARNGLDPWQHFQQYGAQEHRLGSGLDPATFGSFFGPQPAAAAYNPAVGPFDFTGMNAGSAAEPGFFSDYAPPPSSYSEPAYSPPPVAAAPSFDFSDFGGSFGGGGGFLPGTPDPGTYRPGSPGMSPSQAGHASFIAAQQANTRTLQANQASANALLASQAGPLTAPMPPLPYNGPPTNIYAVPLFP